MESSNEYLSAKEIESSKKSDSRNLTEIGLIILVAVVLAIVVRTFVIQLFYIPSASMSPTLKVNDKIFVNKMSYRVGDVNRGDIIVFDAPAMVKTPQIKDLIKRVVGLPGDSVEGRCAPKVTECKVRIFVNGKRLTESYLVQDLVYEPFKAISVPANSVFVMGDNRGDSEDGRYFGPIKIDTIVGRAFLRVWPLSDIGFL